jgi:predicted amidohydrolase
MKVYVGQINSTIGALSSNAELIRKAYDEGVRAGADVVMVPELCVTGYPPRDLLDREHFVDSALAVKDGLVAMTGETTLIFGCIVRNENWCGKPLRNAAIVARNGKVLLVQHKNLLPTYDVFVELRYFEPASQVSIVEIAGRRVGVTI